MFLNLYVQGRVSIFEGVIGCIDESGRKKSLEFNTLAPKGKEQEAFGSGVEGAC